MPKQTTESQAVAMARQAAPAANTEMRELLPYMDGQSYNEARILSELKFHARNHAMSAFEIGKRLIVLKALAPLGRFQELMEGELHLSNRYGRQLMTFARVVVEFAAHTKGLLDPAKLEAMDQRKVILLGEVIPEYADELSEKGTLGGRTLDEWDAKSRDELKEEIQRLKGTIEKGVDQRSKHIDKIHDLESRLNDLLVAKPGKIHNCVSNLRRDIANAIHKFCRTLPVDEKLNELEVSVLHELNAFMLAAASQAVEFVEDRYPETTATGERAYSEMQRRVLDGETLSGAGDMRDIHPDKFHSSNMPSDPLGLADDDEGEAEPARSPKAPKNGRHSH